MAKKRKRKATKKKKAKTPRRASRSRQRITDESVFTLDQAQIDRALYHEYIDCDWEHPPDASQTGHFYYLSVGELKTEAARHLDKEAVAGLFRKQHLRGLWKRYWLAGYLRAPTTPLYTLQELADLIDEYIEYLGRQKKSLVRGGYPRTRFGRCSWLDNRLTPLLPTHIHDTRGVGNAQLRLNVNEIWGMNHEQLMSARTELHTCREAVLERTSNALQDADGNGLTKGILEDLVAASMKIDLRSILRGEERYADLMAKGKRIQKNGWPFPLVGGISALLLTAGHIVKELEIGTFANTVEDLQRITEDIRGVDYFALTASSDTATVNASFDGFWRRGRQEAPFWQRYGTHVAHECEQRFGVSVPIMVSPYLRRKHPKRLQELLDSVPTGPLAIVPTPLGVSDIAHWRFCRAAGGFLPNDFSHKDLLDRHNSIYGEKNMTSAPAVSLWLQKMSDKGTKVLVGPKHHKEHYRFHPSFLNRFRQLRDVHKPE